MKSRDEVFNAVTNEHLEKCWDLAGEYGQHQDEKITCIFELVAGFMAVVQLRLRQFAKKNTDLKELDARYFKALSKLADLFIEKSIPVLPTAAEKLKQQEGRASE